MAEDTEPDVHAIDHMDDHDDDLDIPDDLAFGFANDNASNTYIVDDVDHGALSMEHKKRLQAMTRAEYEQCLSLADAVADGGGPKITTTVMKKAHEIAPLASGPIDYLNMLAAYGDKVRDKHHDGKHDGMIMKTSRQALKEALHCKLYAMQQVLDMKPDAQGVYPSTITVNTCKVINSIEAAEINTSTHGGLFVGTRTLTPEEVELRKKPDVAIREEMRKVEATYQQTLVELRAERPRPYRGLDWSYPVQRAAIKKGIKCLEALEEAREAEMRMRPLPKPPTEPPKIDETAPKYQDEKGKALLKVDKRQRVYDVKEYNWAKTHFDKMATDEEAVSYTHLTLPTKA
mgnify:CR=1 FL=1